MKVSWDTPDTLVIILSRDNLASLANQYGASNVGQISRVIDGRLVRVYVEPDADHYSDRPGHPAASGKFDRGTVMVPPL